MLQLWCAEGAGILVEGDSAAAFAEARKSHRAKKKKLALPQNFRPEDLDALKPDTEDEALQHQHGLRTRRRRARPKAPHLQQHLESCPEGRTQNPFVSEALKVTRKANKPVKEPSLKEASYLANSHLCVCKTEPLILIEGHLLPVYVAVQCTP